MFLWKSLENQFLEDEIESHDVSQTANLYGDQWGVEGMVEDIVSLENPSIDGQDYPERDVDHVILSREQEYAIGKHLSDVFGMLHVALVQDKSQLIKLIDRVVNEPSDKADACSNDLIISLYDKIEVYEYLASTHSLFRKKVLLIRGDLNEAIKTYPFDRDVILSMADTCLQQIRDDSLSKNIRRLVGEINATRNQFVRANMRLVYHVARRHLGKGVSLEDMIQEGVFGLIRAAIKFDHELNIKFSTYSFWWIKQAIRQAIAKQRSMIRYPVHVNDQVNRIYAYRQDYLKTHGQLPTLDECRKALKLPAKQIRDLLGLTNLCVSANSPTYHDSERSIQDDLSYDVVNTPKEAVERQSDEKELNRLLDHLDERETKVLKMRYGIGLPKAYSLNEIAPQLGVSRERVRQIAEEAISKIRSRVND